LGCSWQIPPHGNGSIIAELQFERKNPGSELPGLRDNYGGVIQIDGID
jgi:hypothetical protein